MKEWTGMHDISPEDMGMGKSEEPSWEEKQRASAERESMQKRKEEEERRKRAAGQVRSGEHAEGSGRYGMMKAKRESSLYDKVLDTYMKKLLEQADPAALRLLKNVRLYPLFALTDTGEPMQTYRRNGIIPFFEVPGTGHDIIGYSPKMNMYVFFHDDSEDISDKDKDLQRLMKRVLR